MFATVLIFSAYNIRELVTDVELLLEDLDRMNDIFVQVEDLEDIFELLQEESLGNIRESEDQLPKLRGGDQNEMKDSKVDFR